MLLAAIQAVLIGIITVLPRYGDTNFIDSVTIFGYVSILISMGTLLAILAFVHMYWAERGKGEREKVKQEKKGATTVELRIERSLKRIEEVRGLASILREQIGKMKKEH